MSHRSPFIRLTRRLTGGVAVAATLTHAAAAQSARDVALPDPRRLFDDSWFWGAKGGVVRFGTISDGRVAAPLAGAEWLITRQHGALLIGAEQAFFDRTSLVADPSTGNGARAVAINDARRYSAAALAAPIAIGWARPYAGVGLALQVIRRATPQGGFASQTQLNDVAERVDRGQSLVAPFVIAGMQGQFGRFAVFVQGTAAGEQRRSLWNDGGSAQLEAGLRFNVSSAMER